MFEVTIIIFEIIYKIINKSQAKYGQTQKLGHTCNLLGIAKEIEEIT